MDRLVALSPGNTRANRLANCRLQPCVASECKGLNPMDDMALLHTIPLFSRMTEGELADVFALMERHLFEPGDTILQEGDPGSSFHLVINGHARIFTSDRNGREILLDDAYPGGFIGELSLLTGDPRSASVKAVTDVTTLALERDSFFRFLRQHPHASVNRLTHFRLMTSRT